MAYSAGVGIIFQYVYIYVTLKANTYGPLFWQAMVEKNHVVNARMNKFLIEVVGLATLDRLHKLNRGDSLSDKWCVSCPLLCSRCPA